MGDNGFLTNAMEKDIAKFLDGLVDFDKLLKSKKIIFGLISIGSLLERKDRALFEFMVAYLDDEIVCKTANTELKIKVNEFYILLKNRDVNGIIEYSSKQLATVVDIPFIDYEEQVFKSVLMFTSGIINKSLDKLKEISEKAEK